MERGLSALSVNELDRYLAEGRELGILCVRRDSGV